MKFTIFLLAMLFGLYLVPVAHLTAQRVKADTDPKVVEATKSIDREGEAWWRKRHQAKLKTKNDMDQVDLVFIGDSITHSWEKDGKKVWEQYYEPRNAINLGFSGDKTENVIWRIRHGQVNYIEPKLAIIMIGTNNTGHRQDPPEDTAAGIEQILADLEVKIPETKVLLLGIFPRGKERSTGLRTINDRINDLISDYADDDRVFYMNINAGFLQEDGSISEDIMPDFLHLSERGYEIWAEAIEEKVKELLEEE